MIHVIAIIRAQPGKRGELLAAFRPLVPIVLQEVGCLAYEPTIDAETDMERQDRWGEDVLTMVERWESVPHLNAHLAAPHMAEFRQQHGHLIMGLELHILKPGI